MNLSDKGGEPSMDEILANIRKIISEAPAGSREMSDIPAANPLLSGTELRASPPSGFGAPQVRPPLPSHDRLSDALRTSSAAASSASPPIPRAAAVDDDLADLLDDKPEPSLLPVPPPMLPSVARPSRFGAPVAASEEKATAPISATAGSPFAKKEQEAKAEPAAPATNASATSSPPAAPVKAAFGAPSFGAPSLGAPVPPSADDVAFDATDALPVEATQVEPVAAAAEPEAVSPADANGASPFSRLSTIAANPMMGLRKNSFWPPRGAAAQPAPSIDAPGGLLASKQVSVEPAPVAPAVRADETLIDKLGRLDGLANGSGLNGHSVTPSAAPKARMNGAHRSAFDDLADLLPTDPEPVPSPRPAASAPAAPTPPADTAAQATAAAAASAFDALAQGFAASAAHESARRKIEAELSDIATLVAEPMLPATRESAPLPSRTMEDLVADMLRPMLERWVAENMPRIIERALRVEAASTGHRPGKPPVG